MLRPEPPSADRALDRLRQRALTLLPAKLAVWLGLAAGILIPYFGLQQLSLGAPRSVPVTPLDQWIPFQPGFVYLYLSLGALVPIAPLLATRRDELRRYAIGLALLCVPSFVAFALYPVAGPRPPLPEDVGGVYGLLVSIDRPLNSMPSLHAGLVLYSLGFADRVMAGALAPAVQRGLRFAGGLWGLGILYATIATRQHWFVDLPAGMALAWVGLALSWRGGSRPHAR